MRWSRLKSMTLAICTVTLFAGSVLSCTPSRTPTPKPLPTAAPGTDAKYPLLVPDHVIITGPKWEVYDLIETIEADPELPGIERAELQLIGLPLELGYLMEVWDECLGLLPFEKRPEKGNPYMMALYKIVAGDGVYVGEVPLEIATVERINSVGNKDSVYADAVYRTGRLPEPLVGYPWIGEGSPWIGEGSPWIGEGSDEGDPTVAQGDFWSQWALDMEHGIRVIQAPPDEDSEDPLRSVDSDGDNVLVGVFDTCPISASGTQTVTWVAPPFDLEVHLPELYFRWQVPLGMGLGDPPPPPVSSHGLFAASLVYAVAPASSIHLYRVLDDHLQGDLFSLNAALHHFIELALEEKGEAAGAVINLSLGSHVPQKWLERGMPMLASEAWEDLGVTGEGFELFGMSEKVVGRLPADVTSLGTLLAAAHYHGIVTVAAAGNDGLDSADFPAEFAACISVGASDKGREESCFSNGSTVLSPGGNGSNPGCEPMLENCANGCDFGLTGAVSIDPEDYPTGYAYWTGTSFSTPLVSGLAALVLDSEHRQGTWPVPGAVRRAIDAGTCNGIIDVPHTLLGMACVE